MNTHPLGPGHTSLQLSSAHTGSLELQDFFPRAQTLTTSPLYPMYLLSQQ